MTTSKKKSRPAGRLSKSAFSKSTKTKNSPNKSKPKRTPRQLMLADLKRSGLTEKDARKLGYKPLAALEMKELTGIHSTGYVIPYDDINGKSTDFWRVRYTDKTNDR